MAEVLRKSRKEVEERLKKQTSSIASRLEALESELPVAPKTIRRLTDRKFLLRAGLGLAAGVLAGMAVLRIRRDPNREFRKEIRSVSSAIGKEIRKNMGRGYDEAEAVERAMEKRPPVLNIGHAEGSFWSTLLSQIARQIASALGPVIADRIAARFRRDESEE